MKLTALIVMMLIGLSSITPLEARSMTGNRRGIQPPAVREHMKYYRPKRPRAQMPFEREGYLVLPRRTPPRANGR